MGTEASVNIVTGCIKVVDTFRNVWEYLRGNKLCAIVWDSYEAIVDACCKAWNFLVSDPDRIRSIGAKASLWACVNV